MYNSFQKVSDLNGCLPSGYHSSLLGYAYSDWFVDQVENWEKKLKFFFQSTKKDFIMTGKDEEHCRNINTCLFCEKKVDSNKISDHCHSTGKIRGPAHQRIKDVIWTVNRNEANSFHLIFKTSVIMIVIFSSEL